jgi:hypothetical protein
MRYGFGSVGQPAPSVRVGIYCLCSSAVKLSKQGHAQEFRRMFPHLPIAELRFVAVNVKESAMARRPLKCTIKIDIEYLDAEADAEPYTSALRSFVPQMEVMTRHIDKYEFAVH